MTSHDTTKLDLNFVWSSRKSSALLHADMLCRLEDDSQVFLSHGKWAADVAVSLSMIRSKQTLQF